MPPLTTHFDDALVYASQLHRDQQRKGTTIPYFAHLLAVAGLVLEHGGDEDTAIAALLHDAVEDQGGAATRLEIARRFGEQVAEIVDGCTDTDVSPKPPWRARKEAYLAHLAHAPAPVRLVSAADKLHNTRSIVADHRVYGPAVWARFTGGREGTLWYYRALVAAFRAHGPHPLVDELARTVGELEQVVSTGG